MSIVGHCSADCSDGNFDVSIFCDYFDDGNFDLSIFGCYHDDYSGGDFDLSIFGDYSDDSGNHLVHSIP